MTPRSQKQTKENEGGKGKAESTDESKKKIQRTCSGFYCLSVVQQETTRFLVDPLYTLTQDWRNACTNKNA